MDIYEQYISSYIHIKKVFISHKKLIIPCKKMFQLRLVNFFGNTRDHIELINENEPFLQII